jgi:hypothetical protein
MGHPNRITAGNPSQTLELSKPYAVRTSIIDDALADINLEQNSVKVIHETKNG